MTFGRKRLLRPRCLFITLAHPLIFPLRVVLGALLLQSAYAFYSGEIGELHWYTTLRYLSTLS